jgi:aminoglycoside phosphotransferase (APT) family kinase protein
MQSLSEEQINAALATFGLGTLIASSPPPTGNNGQSLFVSTLSGSYVLRGAPSESDQFEREQFFARSIHSHTDLPCPWPYFQTSDTSILGFPFAFIPRLNGTELRALWPTPSWNAAQWAEIARATAIAAMKLHTFTLPCAGRYSAATGTIACGGGTFQSMVASEIWEKVRDSPAFPASDRQWIGDELHKAAEVTDEPVSVRIVHGDFGYWNMLFEHTQGALNVTGVFDLATAMAGDGIADIAYQYSRLRGSNREAAAIYLSTYLEGREPTRSELVRFNLYILQERINLRHYSYVHAPQWIDWNQSTRDWIEPNLLLG